jgi:hypothetical protein
MPYMISSSQIRDLPDILSAFTANSLTIDLSGYITIDGIHFGGGYPDLYRQTIKNNPAYGHYAWGSTWIYDTVTCLEISGQGLIVDGCINCSGISMNSQMTGYSGLVLDNSDGRNGFIQWGNTYATTVRLAQVVISGHSEQVLAVQAYVGAGGKFNSGTWDLGALDVSLLFCDHIVSASAGGIYLFDDLRLYGPSSGHKLYDSTNNAGTDNYVLTIDPTTHLPQWKPAGITSTFTDIQVNHVIFNGDTTANLTNWNATAGGFISTHGIASSGDFYTPNSLWTAGAVIFNPASLISGAGSGMAYLIWVNNLTLGLLCDASPSGWTTNQYTVNGHNYYFGALDLGAVFVQYVNPIGSLHYVSVVGTQFNDDSSVNFNGDLHLSGSKKIYDSTSNAGANGQFLTINSSGYPVWSSYTPSSWNGGTITNPLSLNGCVLSNDTGNILKIISSYSSVSIGAQNSSYIHFLSNGGLPFYFNNDVFIGDNCHLKFHTNNANFMSWTSGGWQGGTPNYGIATNGDFYVNGNQVLAGGLQFNQGGQSAYIIWSNNYVLTVGASGGPFWYGVGHNYTGYFGAIDCGAVFTSILNPIGNTSSITVGGSLQVSGMITMSLSNYIAWNGDVYLSRANPNVLSINNNAGSLGALNVSTIFTDHINSASGSDVYLFQNLRLYYSGYNLFPYANNDGNVGGNGAGTNYYWGSVWANYLKYHTSNTSFDALDDLSLVKNYKTKTETVTHPTTKESVEVEVVDVENSLPHLLDENGFRDPARDVGFLLGCAKYSALKHDGHDKRLAELEQEIAELRSQLAKKT